MRPAFAGRAAWLAVLVVAACGSENDGFTTVVEDHISITQGVYGQTLSKGSDGNMHYIGLWVVAFPDDLVSDGIFARSGGRGYGLYELPLKPGSYYLCTESLSFSDEDCTDLPMTVGAGIVRVDYVRDSRDDSGWAH